MDEQALRPWYYYQWLIRVLVANTSTNDFLLVLVFSTSSNGHYLLVLLPMANTTSSTSG